MSASSPFDQTASVAEEYAEDDIRRVHPDGGFMLVEDAMDRARQKVVKEAYDKISADVIEEIVFNHAGDHGFGYCSDCDSGCCSDCDTYSEGKSDGYCEGYDDALNGQEHEEMGMSYEAYVYEHLREKLEAEAERKAEEDSKKTRDVSIC